jgi:hypothetical protein
MKYLLLIYADETAMRDEDYLRDCRTQAVQLARELDAAGKYVASSPLQPVSTATSVRVRDGKPLVTDGPFAETREQLGGYLLIDVPDLDEAIRVAARFPVSRSGTVEIRPLGELVGLPPTRAARDEREGPHQGARATSDARA